MKPLGTAITALAVLSAPLWGARPAAAQVGSVLPIRAKIGYFEPNNGIGAEVEVALPSVGAGGTRLAAGYFEGSKNGRRLRMIPLTVSRVFSPPNPLAGATGNVYFGLGVGAYLVHVTGDGDSDDDTKIGGFGVVGYQFPSALFVEAKYHVVGKTAGFDSSGFAFLIGRRF